jgi:hypothetical protein
LYEKTGFKKIKSVKNTIWMIKEKINLRLPSDTILAIQSIFCKYFLPRDSLWVFGSRIDLDEKAGDIDLYIETQIVDIKEALDKKILFLSDLKQKIGDQKIDVVLNIKSLKYDMPIYEIAISEGVKII